MSRYGLPYDPLPPLLSSSDMAVRLRAARELDGQNVDLAALRDLPAVRKKVARQQKDGSWRYPGRRADGATNYEYLETYRALGELVELYALDDAHPAVSRAAEYLFTLQTDEGDFRGIYGKEYSPNYTAGILELMMHAGLEQDERVERGLDGCSPADKWMEDGPPPCAPSAGSSTTPFLVAVNRYGRTPPSHRPI